jgi:hypothetical protein
MDKDKMTRTDMDNMRTVDNDQTYDRTEDKLMTNLSIGDAPERHVFWREMGD